MRFWSTLRAGFRWWMLPALVLVLGGLLALVALAGLSLAPALRYTAIG